MLVCRPPQLLDIVIPKPLRTDMCLWDLEQLDRAQQLFQEGMSNYKRLMSGPCLAGSFGSYKKARLASEAHTRLRLPSHWDSLYQAEQTAISLVATSPPPDNPDVAYSNERRLLTAIYLCDPSLQGLCQDIYTWVRTYIQVTIHVRYPDHMGERLQKLCKVLNTVPVENQEFSAKVVTEGMDPTHWSKSLWLHITGQRLATLDLEAIIAATKRHCEEHHMMLMAQQTYHLCFHKCLECEYQSAVASIWLEDYQWIQDNNRAWRLAQKMASNDEQQTMKVYLLIIKLVIDAAVQGKTQPGPDVFLFTCTSNAIYAGDQELFMSTRVGDTILALDAPFKLTSPVATEGANLDADDGILAVYGFKYEVDDDKGILVRDAGIAMVQHLTNMNHKKQLQRFSAHIPPLIAQFRSKIAVSLSGQAGGPASSSINADELNLALFNEC